MGQEADYNKAMREANADAQHVLKRLNEADKAGVLLEVLEEFYYEIKNTRSSYRQKIDAACWEWDV